MRRSHRELACVVGGIYLGSLFSAATVSDAFVNGSVLVLALLLGATSRAVFESLTR